MGRAPKFVNSYAEFWRIENITKLPDMYGIYFLFDQHRLPLKVGESGGGKQTIRDRIYGQRNDKFKGRKVTFFSAYDLDAGYEHKVEAIVLRSLSLVLPWNENKGHFPDATKRLPEPK